MKKNKNNKNIIFKLLEIDKTNNLTPISFEKYSEYILNNNFQIYIHEDLEIIKGYVIFKKFENYIEVIRIATLKKYRRSGIATKLLLKILAHKKKTILKVRCKNKKAIKLYKKLGFEKITTIGTIKKTDAFLMKFENKRS
ncbi:MAG: GNAT family N-acetyltransferase [Fusobacteriota bacterium]